MKALAVFVLVSIAAIAFPLYLTVTLGEPAGTPREKASPKACHDTISGRLIASFTDAAAPTLPQ